MVRRRAVRMACPVEGGEEEMAAAAAAGRANDAGVPVVDDVLRDVLVVAHRDGDARRLRLLGHPFERLDARRAGLLEEDVVDAGADRGFEEARAVGGAASDQRDARRLGAWQVGDGRPEPHALALSLHPPGLELRAAGRAGATAHEPRLDDVGELRAINLAVE
jgi:hypothetical protein